MKRIISISASAIFVMLAFGSSVLACPQCRAQAKLNIYDENFYSNILVMALPVFVIAVSGIVLFYWDAVNKLRAVREYGEK